MPLPVSKEATSLAKVRRSEEMMRLPLSFLLRVLLHLLVRQPHREFTATFISGATGSQWTMGLCSASTTLRTPRFWP